MIIIMPEMLSKNSMDRDYSQVLIESASNKHIKTAVETDVIEAPIDSEVIEIAEEAEDQLQTMNASYAEKQVIGKQKFFNLGRSCTKWRNLDEKNAEQKLEFEGVSHKHVTKMEGI